MNKMTETPLDSIIERIKSYIKDPRSVTRETLNELLSEVEDLNSSMSEDYADTDEADENEHNEHGEYKNKGKSMLTILIGSPKMDGGKMK